MDLKPDDSYGDACYLCPMALRLLKCTGFGVEICIGKLVAQSESGGVCDSPSHRTIVVSILLLDEFKRSFVSILIGPWDSGVHGFQIIWFVRQKELAKTETQTVKYQIRVREKI